MIKVFEAITKEEGKGIKMFMAGGITNCPDWQTELIGQLKNININADLDIYNPRRKNFPIGDKKASREQIQWEYEKLKAANLIIFWFSRGSLNPIVLYELGMWGNSRFTPIIIGIDKEYEREQDVIIQTSMARPDTVVLSSLMGMAEVIKFQCEEMMGLYH